MSKFNNKCVKGILKVKGTQFVNGDGEPVILTGYATANWQNPEGFMVGQPPRPMEWVFPKDDRQNYFRWDRRRSISQVVRELCGSEYLSTFWDRWEAGYTSEDDIKAMADCGWNSVRMVLNANALLYEEPGIKFNEGAFKRLDDIFDWCEKYKIYIILDMHATVGGVCGCCGDALHSHTPNLLVDDESLERQIILWEELARRYHERWILAGYDLCNEPVSTPPAYFAIPLLEQYYEKCIARIRAIDGGKHIFFLEGPAFARSNEIFGHDYDPGYHNWAINVHIYGADCSLKDLRPYLLKGMELDVPIWISESGSMDVANAVFYDICGHLGVGFSIWGWKTAARDGKTRNVGFNLPKEWDKIAAFITGGPRPSYKKSQEILDEYLENLWYRNCVVNFENARVSQKRPDITLPGVGYDMWKPDGSRYYGNWEWGNYLEFRVEDHTKLIWATDKRHPYPDFNFDCGPMPIVRHNPLTDLALELSEGEFAFYSVHEAEKPCKISVEASSPEGAVIEVSCDDKVLGTLNLAEAKNVLAPVWSDGTAIAPAGETVIVKLTVKSGVAQIKNVRFAY